MPLNEFCPQNKAKHEYPTIYDSDIYCLGHNDCSHFTTPVIHQECKCYAATCPNQRHVSEENIYDVDLVHIGDIITASQMNNLIRSVKTELTRRYSVNNILNDSEDNNSDHQFPDYDKIKNVALGSTINADIFTNLKNAINHMLNDDGFDNYDFKTTWEIKTIYTPGDIITAEQTNELINMIQFIGRQCLCNSRYFCNCHSDHTINNCTSNYENPFEVNNCNCRTVCVRCEPHCVTHDKPYKYCQSQDGKDVTYGY